MKKIFQIAVMVLTVAGCASRPDPTIHPIDASAVGASISSILTVSTRANSDEFGAVYSGERRVVDAEPEFAIVDVSIPPTHERGRLEIPHEFPPDPATEFATVGFKTADHEDVESWFAEHHQDGQLLIFVHGFNVRYTDAVYRLAQLSEDLHTSAAPVLFTWPSRGNLTSYLYDKESATYSRDAFETLLENAAAAPEVKEITILAHSMGTWLVMEALRQSAIRNGRIDSKIKDVILAAPDVDVYVFAQQFETLGPDHPEFTVLISDDDRALRLSRILAGNVSRIGSETANNPEVIAWLREHPGVAIVDMSDLDTGGRLHHGKFAEAAGSLDLINNTIEDRPLDVGARRVSSSAAQSVLIMLSATIDATSAVLLD